LLLVSFIYFAFVFGAAGTEESVFPSSVVFVFSVFNFLLLGDYKGALPFIVFIISFAVNYKN